MPPDPSLPRPNPPIAEVDVYVDDFIIGIAQGNPDRLKKIRNTHSIDSVFRPNDGKDILR
jgi:hypothetical protein